MANTMQHGEQPVSVIVRTTRKAKDRKMLLKFETKSNRVKGLAFHPKRPWILASLHNGIIQLWDYRMETMVDKFEEHEGPVRGVHFHSTQPLFVSGGDDYKVKIWNYEQKRCLFSLLGHLDYIRTVQFHHEYPWILSASDDQTIRIWNWQSRQCLSILTGHNHYVMCAQWHPRDDLILSASLDQTVRIWDFSVLRKKHVTIAGEVSMLQQPPELFGISDVVLKHILEGHTRGVNWASFHKSLNLLVSGADDREIKLWRMSDSKVWEVDTMRGHSNNVSCVVFHPKQEKIISNSEDRSIRIWDISKQSNTITLRRENDRYWILDAHPTLNLIAAGHDSGLIVFKLQRERPPFQIVDSRFLYYYRDFYVFEHDLNTGKEKPILCTRRTTANGNNITYRSLSYNASNKDQHAILLSTNDGQYELYVFSKTESNQNTPVARDTARSVDFVSRNRFAVLDDDRQLHLKSLNNDEKRKISMSNTAILAMYSAGAGRILMRSLDRLFLYDVQALRVIAQLHLACRTPIKYVAWSRDNNFCALFSKTNVIVIDNHLHELANITESMRIKGGVWDPVGVLVYATSTHLKYALPSGDQGILRSLDVPIYLTYANGSTIGYIDRESKIGTITVDTTEYMFKIALMRRRNREVLKLMESKKFLGQSMIAYLHKKGYPEVALYFVEDVRVRFNLALECGNIRIALDCAEQLNNDDCWYKLGAEALRQGNHEVVEAAYQKVRNMERLNFLYLITGNIDKLSKLLKISIRQNDINSRFHNALFMNNVEEKISILRDSGHLKLAYTTAKVNGYDDMASALAEEIGDTELPPIPDTGLPLVTPKPIICGLNWPLRDVKKSFFERLDERELELPVTEPRDTYYDSDDDNRTAFASSFADEPFEETTANHAIGPQSKDFGSTDAVATNGDWGGDLDIPGIDQTTDLDVGNFATTSDKDDVFIMPTSNNFAIDEWSHSSLAAHLVASGSFDLAMNVLNRQIGVVNFAPLKPLFISIMSTAHAMLPMLNGSAVPVPLFTDNENSVSSTAKYPDIFFKLDNLRTKYDHACQLFTQGRFADALPGFYAVLHSAPLLVLSNKTEQMQLLELVHLAREYIIALKLDQAKRASSDPKTQLSNAIHFTACALQNKHLTLGLRQAIRETFTLKNFRSCGALAGRLLELAAQNPDIANDFKDQRAKVTQILQHCERNSTDAVPLDLPSGKYTLCAASLTPILRGEATIKCPYCASTCRQQYEEMVCPICDLSKLGADCTGLRNFSADLM